MARSLRLEFPNAIYHVTARGNAREPVFLDDEDRASYLACLADGVKRFGWICHAYCLMDNHYHLLIETPDANLSVGMRHLNGVYTQRFNRRHERVGHLFQGRFKAIVVERDSYLLELCRYVVLNPIRAGMARHIARYRWSSYPATMGLAVCPEWLSTDWILSQFGKRRAIAQRRYAQFVSDGVNGTSPWSAVRGQTLLGSEAFVEKLRSLLTGMENLKEIPRAQRLLHRPTLGDLFSESMQENKPARDEIIRKAFLEYGYSMTAIASQLGLHYSTISKIVSGVR